MSNSNRTAKLSYYAELNPKLPQPLQNDDLVSFLPMSAVSAETASTTSGEERRYAEVSKGFTPFLDGDVLIAKITPSFENGKIAQAQVNHNVGFGSTEFHVVRPRSGVANARFLLHYLRQRRIRIEGERKMTGSAGQRRVPEYFLADLDIPCRSLPEQRRIAAILDHADTLRAKRRAALAQLDTLAQSIFIDMFGDPATNPKGWQRIPFSGLLANIDSGSSPICLDRPVVGDEWGVLKLGAVTWCEYDPTQNKALPAGTKPETNLEVQPGDLLFTRKNTYALVAASVLVRETPPRLLLPDLIFRLRLRRDAAMESSFLHQLLIYPTKRREIQKLAGGSASSMPNISKGKLQTVMIEVPPHSLQREFAHRIAAIEKLKAMQRTSLAELDALFAALQHRAFRGGL